MLSALQLTGRDRSHLIEWRPGHWLQPQVAEAMEHMTQAANNEGIDLQPVSSFRDCARQLAIWNAKWLGQRPILDIHSRPMDINQLSEQQKLFAILTWSALPGASRHHWGTDLDVYDAAAVNNWPEKFQLIPQEYAQGGPCHKLACWLDKNAQRLGFFQPYQQYTGGIATEPWHLSHRRCADQMQSQLSLMTLQQCIEELDILGKEVILANLPDIYYRFIQLNTEAN